MAAPALVLTAPAIAADPAPKPILVELGGKPAGYALAVAPLDQPKICGAEKVRLQVGTHMAPSLAAWLSTSPPQGAGQTASVYLAGGTQRMTFSGAKVVRVELPVADAQSNARTFFVVELETQPTTCNAVPTKMVAGIGKQAAGWASRATLASGTRLVLADKALTGTRTTGSYAEGGRGTIKAELVASDATAMLEWLVRVSDRKTVELQETLADGGGASVVEILARAQAPNANGKTLELKSDRLQICVFAEGQRICPPAAPAPPK